MTRSTESFPPSPWKEPSRDLQHRGLDEHDYDNGSDNDHDYDNDLKSRTAPWSKYTHTYIGFTLGGRYLLSLTLHLGGKKCFFSWE